MRYSKIAVCVPYQISCLENFNNHLTRLQNSPLHLVSNFMICFGKKSWQASVCHVKWSGDIIWTAGHVFETCGFQESHLFGLTDRAPKLPTQRRTATWRWTLTLCPQASTAATLVTWVTARGWWSRYVIAKPNKWDLRHTASTTHKKLGKLGFGEISGWDENALELLQDNFVTLFFCFFLRMATGCAVCFGISRTMVRVSTLEGLHWD